MKHLIKQNIYRFFNPWNLNLFSLNFDLCSMGILSIANTFNFYKKSRKDKEDSNYSILFGRLTCRRMLIQHGPKLGKNIPQTAHCPYPLKDPSHQIECFYDLWNCNPGLDGNKWNQIKECQITLCVCIHVQLLYLNMHEI